MKTINITFIIASIVFLALIALSVYNAITYGTHISAI